MQELPKLERLETDKPVQISAMPQLNVVGENEAFVVTIHATEYYELADVSVTPERFEEDVKQLICNGIDAGGMMYHSDDGKAVIPAAIEALEAQGYEVIINLALDDLMDAIESDYEEPRDPTLVY